MQVKILNQTFNIQGVSDEAYVQKLASFVEAKLQDTQRMSNIIDSHRLTLLTALQIADEYFQLERRYDELDEFIGKKSVEFLKIFEQFVETAPK